MHPLNVFLLVCLVGGASAGKIIEVEIRGWPDTTRQEDYTAFLADTNTWITVTELGKDGLTTLYNTITSGALAAGPYAIDTSSGTVVVCTGTAVHVYRTDGETLKGTASKNMPYGHTCVSVAADNDINSFMTDKGSVYVLVLNSLTSIDYALSYTFSQHNCTMSQPIDHLVVDGWYVLLCKNTTGHPLLTMQSIANNYFYTPSDFTGYALAKNVDGDGACVRSADITTPNEVVCVDVLEAAASGAETHLPKMWWVLLAGAVVIYWSR